MKKSIDVLLLMVCSNTLLFTQTPNPAPKEVQSYPQLQEWWRADNKGYGIEGATWLDNFYHGKGALVVSTSTGAKTWLLEYPGDTNNVFTWRGCCGDGDIKTLDINGDGIRDYLNGSGRLWLGIQNGEPPAETPSAVLTGANTEEYKVVDLNRDGLDDLLSFRKSSAPFFIIRTFFGNKKNVPTVFVEYPIVGMDTTEEFISIYTMPNGEVRLTALRRPYSQIEKAYMQDSWVIYKAVWDSTAKVLRVEQLAILGTTQKYASLSYDRIITQGDKRFLILFQLRIASKIPNEVNMKQFAHVYDVSDDRFILKQTASIDTMRLYLLHKDFDGDGLYDCYYIKDNLETNRSKAIVTPFTDSLEYSKSTSNQFSPINRVIAAKDFNGDGREDVIVVANNELTVLLGGVPTSVVNESSDFKDTQSLKSYFDQSKYELSVELPFKDETVAEIQISDVRGINVFREEYASALVSEPLHRLHILLPNLAKGVYILSARIANETFSTKFIIE